MLTWIMRIAIIGGLLFFFPGCFSIMQWQRQYLGDQIMQFNHDPHENSLNDHIYPRREGSSGGTGSAGGGCGC